MSLAFLVLLPFLGVLLPPFAARLKASPTVMAISAAVLPALALAVTSIKGIARTCDAVGRAP